MSDKAAVLKDIKKKYGNVIKTGSELIDQRKDYKQISISPALDIALKGGIREGTFLMLSGAPKSGKALCEDEIVYTPSGPVKIKDINKGDLVCGPNNTIGTVKNKYILGGRDSYRINFSDGTSVECDGEHLWRVSVNSTSSVESVKTTEQLRERISYPDRDRWRLKSTSISFSPKTISLDPYLYGVIMADGYINSEGFLYLKLTKEHVKSKVSDILNSYNCILENDIYAGKILSRGTENFVIYTIMNFLNSKNLPHQRSEFFIPDHYKYNTSNIRHELLAGYLSCNAYQHTSGYYEVESSNYALITDIAEIARSLGYLAYINPRKETSNRLTINSGGDMLCKTFSAKSNTKSFHKTINSIEPIGLRRCECIEVEGTDSLYVTNGINVTHNTTTAMQLAFNCQQEGRPVIYINAEGRLSELNFEVKGLDPAKMQIVTAETEPLSAETFLEIALQLISLKENEGALCIIDSVSSLIPSKELDEDVTGMARPGLPKILSNFCKKAGQIVPNNKITMCMITHLITNTSGYGPSRMADSGVKIQYQADTRLEVKSISPWEQKEKQIGQAVNWKIYYSSNGATGVECQSWIKYGEGIDSVQELLILGEELALISKAGSWYTLDFLKNDEKFKSMFPDADPEKFCKFQGQEKLYNFLVDNKEVCEMLRGYVIGMLA